MTNPQPAESIAELMRSLDGVLHVADERLVMDDEDGFRAEGVRNAVWSATFSSDTGVIEVARWIIWEASQALGAPSASINALYMARGRGEVNGFTVPAVNLRTQVFDMAAAMCHAADSIEAGTIIFELARSEQEYTFQRPGEYITSVLAGCIHAGWEGPVFVQGDHYQF
ncbi:MAG: class II fructose-bisphosphate aldolase, partial [Candidatus Limnocylindrales bacterium]